MDLELKNSTTFKVLLDIYNLIQHVVHGHTLDLLMSHADFRELISVSCGVCE